MKWASLRQITFTIQSIHSICAVCALACSWLITLCALFLAKGRTNVELREKFILPEGTTQVMASFRYRGRRSRPSSRGASPNRSNSSHSCPAQPNPAAPGTPKVGALSIGYFCRMWDIVLILLLRVAHRHH